MTYPVGGGPWRAPRDIIRAQLSRHCAGIAVATALLSALLAPVVTLAQTADQIKAMQGLTPAQREALVRQAGTQPGTAPGDNQIVVQQPLGHSPGDSQQGPLVIKGGEQVLLQLADSGAPTTDSQERIAATRERLLRGNPYTLTSDGLLRLPGFTPIVLAGLTPTEAQQRLALDSLFRNFTVTLTLLRVAPNGTSALKPFGYDMFRGTSTAFVPGTDIPAPPDYLLGPGDVLSVQLYGQRSQIIALPVGRDGSVAFPDLGPIAVGGISFAAARNLLESRVSKQILGTRARVTLTELRSARVLVLGDAEHPGSYVVSSLSTVTNALFVAGGVKQIGSLRRIEVKRDGKLVRRLDLYDVLLHGDTVNDVRLQTGDVVFVPPVGTTVAIDGEVKRPAIYELKTEKTVDDMVALAGGFTSEADRRRVAVEGIGEGGARTIANIDLGTAPGRATAVRAGYVVRVGALRPVVENGISVSGEVYRSGSYGFHSGMRLTEVLGSIDELKPSADAHYVLIRREAPETRRVSVVSADLAAALAKPGSDDDLPLAPRDSIIIFALTSPRDQIIGPLMDELQRQSAPSELAPVVTVSGRVNAPGRYPIEPGMRVRDLLRAGAGLQDSAYAVTAELARYTVINGEQMRVSLQDIDLAAVLRGDQTANSVLQPYDVLTVKEMPEWTRNEQVELVGEIRFPGIYQIRPGETLRSVLQRAGGLTPLAFASGAVFTREELKRREREQIDRLAGRLQGDVAALALQTAQTPGGLRTTNPSTSDALAAGQALLEQLRHTQPVGRLVVDIEHMMAPSAGANMDLTLRDHDRLLVPRLTHEVTVLGEVQNPTSHFYRKGLTKDDAIALSGGLTEHADRARSYVVKADGSVQDNTMGWRRSRRVGLEAGDTVVVPVDTQKMRPLTLWTAVTTIIYNMAVGLAAISRL